MINALTGAYVCHFWLHKMRKKIFFIIFLLSLPASGPLQAQEYSAIIIQINGKPLLVIKKNIVNLENELYVMGMGIEIASVPYESQCARGTDNSIPGSLMGYLYSAGGFMLSFFTSYRGFGRELLQELTTFAQALGDKKMYAVDLTCLNNIQFHADSPGSMLTTAIAGTSNRMIRKVSPDVMAIDIPKGGILGDLPTIFQVSSGSPSPLSVLFNSHVLGG